MDASVWALLDPIDNVDSAAATTKTPSACGDRHPATSSTNQSPHNGQHFAKCRLQPSSVAAISQSFLVNRYSNRDVILLCDWLRECKCLRTSQHCGSRENVACTFFLHVNQITKLNTNPTVNVTLQA